MKKIVTLLLLCPFMLAGCLKSEEEPSREITYWYMGTETFSVASEKGLYYPAGGGPYPCTMLRKGGSDNWRAIFIGGFDEYEEGYEYTLLVDKYRVIVPQTMYGCYDGPGYTYKLKQVLSKVQRDTENIAWFMPCYDSWYGMPESWPATPQGELIVIRTADEYGELIAPADQYTEAFLEYNSILVVSGEYPYGIGRIEKKLTYNGGGNYTLVLDIYTQLSAVITPWTVAVMVPAIKPGANIDVQVNYI